MATNSYLRSTALLGSRLLEPFLQLLDLKGGFDTIHCPGLLFSPLFLKCFSLILLRPHGRAVLTRSKPLLGLLDFGLLLLFPAPCPWNAFGVTSSSLAPSASPVRPHTPLGFKVKHSKASTEGHQQEKYIRERECKAQKRDR